MIFLLLLALNALPLLLLKTSKKYWIVAVPVWIVLLGVLAVRRIQDDRAYHSSEKAYYASYGKNNFGTPETWKAMEKTSLVAAANSRKAFVAVGVQTLCTFFLMATGFKRTKDKRYKWGKWFFGCCTVFVIFMGLMMTLILGSPFN
jgi:hypothetical protein